MNAVKLILRWKDLEHVLEEGLTEVQRQGVPEVFPYARARALFQEEPEAAAMAALDLTFTEPKYLELRQLLVEEHNFSGERIDKVLDRLRATRTMKVQKTMADFFTPVPTQIKTSDKFTAKVAGQRGQAAAAKAKAGRKQPLTAAKVAERMTKRARQD